MKVLKNSFFCNGFANFAIILVLLIQILIPSQISNSVYSFLELKFFKVESIINFQPTMKIVCPDNSQKCKMVIFEDEQSDLISFEFSQFDGFFNFFITVSQFFHLSSYLFLNQNEFFSFYELPKTPPPIN